MFYLVYKTTNIVNGKIYIGAHRTTILNDGYIGSGMRFKRAVEKYGKHNFRREILFFCESAEEMMDKERELVNEDFIKRSDTYNLILGGNCGAVDAKSTEYYKSGQQLDNIKLAKIKSNEVKNTNMLARIEKYNQQPTLCKCCNASLEYAKRRSKFCNSSCAATYNNTGRVISEEQKLKVSKTNITSVGLAKKRRKQENEFKLQYRLSQLSKLDIDQNKKGWVTEIGKALGICTGYVKHWLHKYAPEFLSEPCYNK